MVVQPGLCQTWLETRITDFLMMQFNWSYCRVFSGQFFCIFEIIFFGFVVAICDLVHDVDTIFHVSYVLTASGNLS